MSSSLLANAGVVNKVPYLGSQPNTGQLKGLTSLRKTSKCKNSFFNWSCQGWISINKFKQGNRIYLIIRSQVLWKSHRGQNLTKSKTKTDDAAECFASMIWTLYWYGSSSLLLHCLVSSSNIAKGRTKPPSTQSRSNSHLFSTDENDGTICVVAACIFLDDYTKCT